MIEVPIEMEISTSYQPRTGSGSDLPDVTVDDNGKILKVINGKWNKGDETKELPDVTQQDDGKVLTVVNGEWNKANVPSSSELPDITQEDDGKILRVVNGQWAKSTESSGGLSNDAKDALLNLFQVVAYTAVDAQEYYEALENALYPKNLVSISAVFTQGANVIYDTDFLDDLRQYLVVTAHYDDETSETISAYTLSGNLIAGTSTITVTYQNKTTTFDVNVTHVAGTCSIANSLVGCTTSNGATSITEGDSYTATITALAGYTMTDAQVEITMDEVDITSSVYSNGIISIGEVTGNLIITVTAQAITLSSISAVYTQVGTVYTTDNINNFKSNLVVTAHYNDSSEAEIASANYTLSGTLTVGTSVITVSYGGQTTTFNVIVSEPVVLSSISAVYTPDGQIFDDTPLVNLKDNLVVTALYSDNTSAIVNANDYTLSGTLQEGTSTIVVTYQNKTTTFNVTVTVDDWDYKWVASNSGHTTPDGMTYYGTPTWGNNDEYAQITSPILEVLPYGNGTLEIECAWVEKYVYSANTQFTIASDLKTAAKLYLNSNTTNVVFQGGANGSTTPETLPVTYTDFHKYKMVLDGTTVTLYIDDVLYGTKTTYNSQWNGAPYIYSQYQESQYQSKVKFKSIKYKR